MRKLFIVITCLFLKTILLTGCGLVHPYQPDIQQGNLISQAMAERVGVGMSKDQVRNALGNSLLANPFDENHWAYVYTFQHNGGVISRKTLDIYFQNGRVSRIGSNEGKIS